MEREFKVEEQNKCPLCGYDQFKYIMTGFDDRFGQPDKYDIVECQKCALGFLKQLIRPEDLGELYNKYYWQSDLDNNQLSIKQEADNERLRLIQFIRNLLIYPSRMDFVGMIHSGKDILEIGCGPFSRPKQYLDRGMQWTGLEIDIGACEQIRTQGFNCIHGTVEGLTANDSNNFDVIIGSQVLEHVINPRSFIRSCTKILRPEGQLIFSIPNYNAPSRKYTGQKWINWHIPYHRFHYNRDSLGFLAKVEGLKITRFKLRTPVFWVLFQMCMNKSLPICGQKNIDIWNSCKKNNRIPALIKSWSNMLFGQGEAIVVEMRPISKS